VGRDRWGLDQRVYPLEEYEAACVRESGVWRKVGGRVGFSVDTPEEIRELAAAMRVDTEPADPA
jgi:hypothetical protein